MDEIVVALADRIRNVETMDDAPRFGGHDEGQATSAGSSSPEWFSYTP